MKKIFQRTFLLSLLFLTNFILSDDCSTNFINQLESECKRFFSNSTHTCEYSGGKCGFKYISCSSYEGQDESTCSSIKPSKLYKKCEIQGTQCTEVDKKCEDFEEGLTCYSLSHENNQRCVFNEGKCTTYYNSCTEAPRDKCNNNIPSNSAKKCEWDSANSVCNEVDKKCNDYPDSIPSGENCGNYQTSDSTKKVCFPKQTGGCEERYKTCELYNSKASSKNRNDCLAIQPYIDGRFDNSKICDYTGDVCSTRDKSCQDITEGETACLSFNPKDTNKRCIYSGSQCKEQYKTCELYDQNASPKDETECKNIKLYNNYGELDTDNVCDYINSECKQRPKKCSEYKTEEECEYKTYDDFVCIFKGNTCTEQYKTCELYNSKASNKNKNDCLAIQSYINYKFDDSKICDYTGDVCSTRDKKCEDITEGETACLSFIPNDSNKRCIYSGSQCKEQYRSCYLYNKYASPKDETECKNIKLYEYGNLNTKEYCDFVDSECVQKQKTCSELTSQKDCESSYFEDYICVFKGNKCKEQYKTCDKYNKLVAESAKNKDDCESINEDSYNKCSFNTNTKVCSKIKKDCKEISTSLCSNHTPTDTTKKCILINDKCVEQYKTCELYDAQTTKTADVCNKIIPYRTNANYIDEDYKCVFDSKNSKCERKKKECKDITDSDTCTLFSPEDSTNKICIYENNACKEVYKSCENYNTDANKNEAGCKAVTYRDSYGAINYHYKCIYEQNTCKEKKLESCSDYETRLGNTNYCTYISLTDYKRCVINNNNQCVKKYTNCPGSNERVIENVCNSIELSSEYLKCAFDENKNCVQKEKECSEYKGDYQYYCERYAKSYDKNKKCFYENDKCVSKYIYCSAYEGNDKKTCESIIPYDESNGNSLYSHKKCSLIEDACTMVDKQCSDAQTYSECNTLNIYLSDPNKKCVYDNNKCLEQWKDCSTYNNNAETVEKNICESIILNDYKTKCIFTEGTPKNKCESGNKVCTDFNIDYYQNYCSSTLTSFEKKCVYSNSDCKESKKTCLELSSISGVTSDICSSASTSSSSKRCSLKDDNSGCEEVNKPSKGSMGPEVKFSLLLAVIALLL